jgi:hypothetical protein
MKLGETSEEDRKKGFIRYKNLPRVHRSRRPLSSRVVTLVNCLVKGENFLLVTPHIRNPIIRNRTPHCPKAKSLTQPPLSGKVANTSKLICDQGDMRTHHRSPGHPSIKFPKVAAAHTNR